jgi:hypothetical protein
MGMLTRFALNAMFPAHNALIIHKLEINLDALHVQKVTTTDIILFSNV